MRHPVQLSLLLVFCCAFGAQPQAAPDTKPTGAGLSQKDAGYIEEDPILARLIGKPAPALTLKSIDGKPINLSELYGKRPVYLKLWATYCVPCRVQMPGLKKIFASAGDRMAIIAVNAGIGDDIGKVKDFIQEYDLRMPVAADDGRLGAWVGMRATPVHLVIGRDGRLIFAGHQDGPVLEAAIAQALASTAAPAGATTTRLADLATLKTGDMVPPIELQSSDGKTIALPHGSGSRLRAIYFSATWCESYMKKTQPAEAERCKNGREQTDKLASDPRIAWFGVISHMWTEPADLAKYESKMQPRFPLAVNSSGTAFRTFGVTRFPAIALIDTHGRLAKLVEGDPGQFAGAISAVPARR